MTYKELLIEVKEKYQDIEFIDTVVSRILDYKFNISAQDYIVEYSGQEIASKDEKQIRDILKKVDSGIDLDKVLGVSNFFGREFKVSKGTLAPRKETEIMVEHLIKILKETDYKDLKILDLCTGTGVIGITLQKELGSKVTLSDISSSVLKVAEHNVKKFDAEAKLVKSDLFEKFEHERFDVIVGNPPYLSAKDMKEFKKTTKNDPALALFGGIDGLDFYRKIFKEMPKHLTWSKNVVALEFGHDQKEVLDEMIKEETKGYSFKFFKDYSGNFRYVLLWN